MSELEPGMEPGPVSDPNLRESTGARPYRRRPRKTDLTVAPAVPVEGKPVRKSRGRKVAEPEPVSAAVADLDPSRRTTPMERRRVLVAALSMAARILESPDMPPSARGRALGDVRAIVALISAEDAASTETAGTWADRPAIPS